MSASLPARSSATSVPGFLPIGLMDELVPPGTPAALHMKMAKAEIARTADRAQETAVASVKTIGVRLSMLASTGGDPVALSNPEFELMGREKIEAFAASTVAVVGGMRAFQDAWWRWRSTQIDAMGHFASSALSSPHPGDWLVAETRLMRVSARAAAGALTRFTHAVSRMANLGLAPIHAVASANARRLTEQETIPANE